MVRPQRFGKRYFATRDAGITGFSHVGLFTTDPVRDELFWTEVCNASVSDRIGDIALMRFNAIHHTMALAPGRGVRHINHQVESNDDVLRSCYHLSGQKAPIVFGLCRHPTFWHALPAFSGSERDGVRVVGRRRRDRGRGNAPAPGNSASSHRVSVCGVPRLYARDSLTPPGRWVSRTTRY
nr:VOC family protein [Bradyrhizobium sp. 1]